MKKTRWALACFSFLPQQSSHAMLPSLQAATFEYVVLPLGQAFLDVCGAEWDMAPYKYDREEPLYGQWFFAAKQGDLPMLESYLEGPFYAPENALFSGTRQELLDRRHRQAGCTAFYLACAHGRGQVALFLSEQGINPMIGDDQDQMPPYGGPGQVSVDTGQKVYKEVYRAYQAPVLVFSSWLREALGQSAQEGPWRQISPMYLLPKIERLSERPYPIVGDPARLLISAAKHDRAYQVLALLACGAEVKAEAMRQACGQANTQVLTILAQAGEDTRQERLLEVARKTEARKPTRVFYRRAIRVYRAVKLGVKIGIALCLLNALWPCITKGQVGPKPAKKTRPTWRQGFAGLESWGLFSWSPTLCLQKKTLPWGAFWPAPSRFGAPFP